MKACTKCGETKALEAFSRRASAPDGRRSQCKSCDSREQRERYLLRDEERKSIAAALARNARRRRLKARDPLYTPRRAGRHWRAENPERFREVCREAAKRGSGELRDCYVSRLIVGRSGTATAVPPDLVALKREQLRLHRLAKQLKQAIHDQQESENES